MNAKDAIQNALTSTQHLLGWYISDLSDTDLLVRPVPGANHIAWQLGHLILSEADLVRQQIPSAAYPELPAGFIERHKRDAAADESVKGYATKDEYLQLFNQIRQATLTALANLADADLDKPTTGQIARFAPTVGALLILVSNHTLMHAGQFTVVRRKLGKPVLF
ncbi:MAG TPA: DinB family protein [Gemmataceae bacterium]|nr:DinB family protein [Gemmataceae bacterium]